MDIHIGDNITISGKVRKIENGCVKIETKHYNQFWVQPEDIQTLRPIVDREEDDLK